MLNNYVLNAEFPFNDAEQTITQGVFTLIFQCLMQIKISFLLHNNILTCGGVITNVTARQALRHFPH